MLELLGGREAVGLCGAGGVTQCGRLRGTFSKHKKSESLSGGYVESNILVFPANTQSFSAVTAADSLVGLLPVGPVLPGPTVVGLDYEGVLLLALTVHRATGPQDSFA